jgi:SAC3/GANP/Nin1/mts3/eIF-3 p25 family.
MLLITNSGKVSFIKYMYGFFRLCDEPMSRFDSKINDSHLLECLKQLLVLYDELKYTGHSRHEMEALYLLWTLGDVHALTRALQLPPVMRNNQIVKEAFAVSRAMWCGNYVSVCSLVKQLPPLLKCASMLQLPSVRRYGSCFHNLCCIPIFW